MTKLVGVNLNKSQIGFLLMLVRQQTKKHRASERRFDGKVEPGSGLETRIRLARELDEILKGAKAYVDQKEEHVSRRLGSDQRDGMGEKGHEAGIHGSVLGRGRIFPERDSD